MDVYAIDKEHGYILLSSNADSMTEAMKIISDDFQHYSRSGYEIKIETDDLPEYVNKITVTWDSFLPNCVIGSPNV